MSIENPKYFSADADSEPEKNKKEQQPSEEKLKDEVEQFLAEQLAQDTEFFSKELTPEEFRVWQERNQTDFIHLPKEKQDALITNLGNKLGEISKQIKEAEKNPTNLPKGSLEYLRNYQRTVRNKLQAYHLASGLENRRSQQTPEKQPKNRWNLIGEQLTQDKQQYQEEFKKLSPEQQKIELDNTKKQIKELQKQKLDTEEQLKTTALSDAASDRTESPEQDILKNKIQSIDRELGAFSKKLNAYEEFLKQASETQSLSEQKPETTKQSQKPQEQASEQLNLKQNVLGIISNAEVVINQKKLDPKYKIELLNDYAKKLAELTKSSPEKISLTELIKDKNKLNEFINLILNIKEEEKQTPKPEVVQKAKEFIKDTKEKNKESTFQKIGGLKFLGEMLSFSFFMLLIFAILGEFKLLEKVSGFNLDLGSGGKGKK